jgi:hydroxypyruvate isomerase
MSGQGWKMRYASHLGLRSAKDPTFANSAGSADPIEQIRYAASVGFGGVEDNSAKTRTPEMQERMGAELARLGLEMGCFVNNPTRWNQPLWGRSDDEARGLLADDIDASIETAKRLNGRVATVVSGRDPAIPLAFQLANMVENLKRFGDVAARAGLTLAVETVDNERWPGMLLNHIADAYAVVRAVDNPAVMLLFDVGHVQAMDGQILDNLARTWDRIAVIQAADIPSRFELGSGELNWTNILRFIRDRGYTGLVELEHVNSTPGTDGERIMMDRLRAIDASI